MSGNLFIKVTPDTVKEKAGKKVTVVGTGAVGMASAYAMMIENVANSICLIDVVADKIKGEVMDMQHGEQFIHHTKISGGTDYALSADSDIVVITAGVRQQEGESRLNLVQRNVEIFKKIVPELVKYSPNCLIVVVSNPVDLMSYVTWKTSGLPKHRIIGTGCMLDSARFRYLLGQKLNVSSKSVHGYIIGEHGDSSVPVWSCVNVAGVKLSTHYPKIGQSDDPDQFAKIHQDVISSAYDIIKLKGYTSWAIGLASSHLVKAILSNSHGVYPLSTYVKGIHGIDKDVFISVPCLVTSSGITHIIQQELNSEEIAKLHKSADTLAEVQNGLKF